MRTPHVAAARAALWEAMVERAEAVNDVVVLGQRRALRRSARQIHTLALELTALAQAALILARPGARR